MLVLSRKINEKILFPTIHASVQVVSVKPGVVRLGIQAPPEVAVLREEVQQRQAEWQAPTSAAPLPPDIDLRQLTELVRKRLAVTTKGVKLLQNQLRAGMLTDAQGTLGELSDDLQMLLERLENPRPRTHNRVARPCKALLVEDDQNERELLASFLRLGGLQVDTAGDGSDALDYLRQQERPDVVLLDMGMPRCDGATAVREIRRNPAFAGLKIFAVSGHTPDEYDLASGPTGIDRWYSKPVDPLILLQNLGEELACSIERV